MKDKHIKQEVGLAALVGAFALAFLTTAPATLALNGQMVATANAAVHVIDADRDGVDDTYDAVENRSYTYADVNASRQAAVLRAAAPVVETEM
jgi:hypothetical protein